MNEDTDNNQFIEVPIPLSYQRTAQEIDEVNTDVNTSVDIRNCCEVEADCRSVMSQISVELLQKVLKDDYPDVVIQDFEGAPGTNRGDNYISMVYRITVKGTRKCADIEEPWRRTFFYKCLPESDERREAFKSDELFANEAAFYNKTWPVLLKFQESRSRKIENPFVWIPKCFLAKPDMMLLKDLKNHGFVMPDRKKGLSVEETYVVLRHMSHFHALSLAMKHNDPEGFSELLKNDGIREVYYTEENIDYYKEYYRVAAQNAIDMVNEGLEDCENKDLYMNKMKDFYDEDKFFQLMLDMVAPKEPLAVIAHGDCWTNNFLFKYEGSAISQMYFLDFQLARYSSPSLDLAYMLYLCLERHQRDRHLNSMLHFYTDELHKRLIELSDDGSIFHTTLSRDRLWTLIQEDFRTNSRFGLGLAIDMYPIMTCDSDEAPNLYAKNLESTWTGPVTTTNAACRRKMTDLVQELVDNGLL